MSSTIADLCNELKNKPTHINNFNKILEFFISKKIAVSQKLSSNNLMCDILKAYLNKIDKKNQQTTYNFLITVVEKYTQILIDLSKQDPFEGLSALSSFITAIPIKNICIKTVVSVITSGQKKQIEWCMLNNCSILKLIFIQLHNKITNIKQNNQNAICERILNFLFQIEHINDLTADQTVKTEVFNSDPNRQFKVAFQKLFIQCLTKIQEEEQISVKIYHKLGDKVFSKFQSPLIIAQLLLTKFNERQSNPGVQIEVLSCLFIVVGKYGLEMDKFYQSLENMISHKRGIFNSLFRLKNSKRFLKLVQASMRSSRVPFKTILVLIKLIIKQIFKQESEYCFWALSFLVNLVKKHRQLEKHLSEIPELQCLKNHYSPKIRSLIGELSKNLNKSQYLDIEQFGRVSCEKLSKQKLIEIGQKMQANDQQIQLKIGKEYKFL